MIVSINTSSNTRGARTIDTIKPIESQRNELAKQIASVGEFRPGNLYANARKCGNPNCQCARPDGTLHRG